MMAGGAAQLEKIKRPKKPAETESIRAPRHPWRPKTNARIKRRNPQLKVYKQGYYSVASDKQNPPLVEGSVLLTGGDEG